MSNSFNVMLCHSHSLESTRHVSHVTTEGAAGTTWGPPKPLKAVLETVFVLQQRPRTSIFGMYRQFSIWANARSTTPPLRSREQPALTYRLAWSATILPSEVNPTFQSTRKGCRWPVVWMSSERSSMHRTGRLAFFAATATIAESYHNSSVIHSWSEGKPSRHVKNIPEMTVSLCHQRHPPCVCPEQQYGSEVH